MSDHDVDYPDKDGPGYCTLEVDTSDDGYTRFNPRNASGEQLIIDLEREAVLQLIDQLDDWVARTTPPWTRRSTPTGCMCPLGYDSSPWLHHRDCPVYDPKDNPRLKQ